MSNCTLKIFPNSFYPSRQLKHETFRAQAALWAGVHRTRGGRHGPVGCSLGQGLHGLLSSPDATTTRYFRKVIAAYRDFVSLSENGKDGVRRSLRVLPAPDLVLSSLEARRLSVAFSGQ